MTTHGSTFRKTLNEMTAIVSAIGVYASGLGVQQATKTGYAKILQVYSCFSPTKVDTPL